MKRRGIGNVIAAAIMVFLLIFTVSQLYVYNLDKLDDYNRVAAQMLNTSGQKGNERISITNAQLDASGSTTKVTLTITNTGGTTAHIVDVWMDDVTSSISQHQHCYKGGCSGWTTELYVGSGLSLTMPQLDSTMPNNHLIAVKVFTELGVSTSVQLLPPGLAGTQSNLLATTQMTLVPPNPITSNDIIVLLTVANTNSLGVGFTSLTPDICLVQGNTAPLVSTAASGTTTSATSTTLVTSQSWSANQWANYLVVITSGTGVGQSRLISSNTATTLTVTRAWDTNKNPDSTSTYAIRIDCHAKTAITGTATSGASFSLTDTTKSWTANQWTNYQVTITTGAGAGQTRVISSNTVTPPTLTVSTAWTTNPDATSQYQIQSTIDVSGTATSGTSTTLADTSKAWTTNQWANYLVAITAGTGAGQTALIFSNTLNTLTISGTWTMNPDATSKYIIQTNTCDTTTGSTTISPVTCTLVQGPSPSSVSFLQAGGSITFQWIYAVAAIVPDSSLTFTASYVNIATTDGLLASQIPSQVAIVRAAGGATANSGGNFASAFGDLVNLFPTFQFSTDCGVTWATATGITRSASPLLFRVSLVNVGSTTIQFGTGSEAFLQKIGASSSKDFYVIQSFGPPSCSLFSYTSLQSIAPGATLTLYFAATGAGGNNAQALSGNSGERYIVTVVLSGTRTSGPGVPPGGSPFAQAITVLLVTAA